MGVPFQVTFHELWPTDEVMAIVGQRVQGLQSTRGDVDRCDVVIDRPRHRKGKGRKFRVAITLALGVDTAAARAEATSEHAKLEAALARAFHVVESRAGLVPVGSRGTLRSAA
jgi:hypothetical protein